MSHNISRIKSVPLMSDRKTMPRIKASDSSTAVSQRGAQSQIYNESFVPDSAENKSVGNQSHLPSIMGKESHRNQSIFFTDQPRGYYDLKKMFGR
jgi:hypothetical protein